MSPRIAAQTENGRRCLPAALGGLPMDRRTSIPSTDPGQAGRDAPLDRRQCTGHPAIARQLGRSANTIGYTRNAERLRTAHFVAGHAGIHDTLSDYYGDQIALASLSAYINTEGWVDAGRVVTSDRELQRSRLGGIVLDRGIFHSGHVVSWNFAAPDSAGGVAILVPESTPSSIRIIAYNLERNPVRASMVTWDVDPGTWEFVQSASEGQSGIADSVLAKRTLAIERGGNVQITFPPRRTTILTFRLRSQAIPSWQRADLGISTEDIRRAGDTLYVRVHSLGSVGAPAATLGLTGREKLIASSLIPALPALLDSASQALEIPLAIPANTDLRDCSVQIDPGQTLVEITRANNEVSLSETPEVAIGR